MKKICTILFFALPAFGFSQVDVSGTIDDKANEKLGDAIDGVWSAPGKILDKKKEKKENADSTKTTTTTTTTNTTSGPAATTSTANSVPTIQAYQNYDFVAGSDLIFADNFTEDQDGEFPSHWNLNSGQAVVNKISSIPTFCLTDGNYVRVNPNITNAKYFGNAFTVETDIYFASGDFGLIAFFYAGEEEQMQINVNSSEASASFPGSNGLSANYPANFGTTNFENKWHHVAIAYKDKQVKVYVDQLRVLVVPNCNCAPTSLQLGGIGSLDNPIKFTNVRLANGGNMNMIDKLNTDGKIISYGISFDVGKSQLRPESMGTINGIYKMLTENPDLKLEVDGYTDSDGDDTKNMSLSEDRANAVRDQLVGMGIAGSRLSAKGFGETKPIGDNGTFDGKAKNRRVEFVKK